jgi:hypothetical protein
MTFYTDVIKKDTRFNSTDAIRDVMLLEPGTRAAVHDLIADAASQGKELRIAETYRSQARQHALFMKGYTQLPKVGCHGFGVACDLALYEHGVYQSDGEAYAFLDDLAEKHGLISGISWGTRSQTHSFRDWDHVQRVPVFRQGALFSGAWFPPTRYDPWGDQKSQHIV